MGHFYVRTQISPLAEVAKGRLQKAIKAFAGKNADALLAMEEWQDINRTESFTDQLFCNYGSGGSDR